jgi:hypothetical protein
MTAGDTANANSDQRPRTGLQADDSVAEFSLAPRIAHHQLQDELFPVGPSVSCPLRLRTPHNRWKHSQQRQRSNRRSFFQGFKRHGHKHDSTTCSLGD